MPRTKIKHLRNAKRLDTFCKSVAKDLKAQHGPLPGSQNAKDRAAALAARLGHAVLDLGPDEGVIHFNEKQVEAAAKAAFDTYYTVWGDELSKWKFSIDKRTWHRVVHAVINSLSLSPYTAACRKTRNRASRTTQTKNCVHTEEKSGSCSQRCESRVHAAAESPHGVSMRVGKRSVKRNSPKPTARANTPGRNAKHERRLRSELIAQRNGRYRPIRQAHSPRQGSSRTPRKPGKNPR